jgi:FkbM family methyltransferase
LDEDLFEVDFRDFKVTDNLRMVCTFAEMIYRYKVTKLETDYYRVTGYKFTLEGSSMMLFIWRELISGEYKADYKDKVVLDIGGFQGETAIHYWLSGAKKIIVYEPFSKNCQLIEKNIKLNGANVEVHKAGISEKDGNQLLEVFAAHPDDEKNKELVKLKNITEIINESGADIAKLDCEGAEACLTTVPNNTLRKISKYMLEIHSQEIERNLIEKFTDAGFKVAKLKKMSADISIAYFNL